MIHGINWVNKWCYNWVDNFLLVINDSDNDILTKYAEFTRARKCCGDHILKWEQEKELFESTDNIKEAFFFRDFNLKQTQTRVPYSGNYRSRNQHEGN